MEELCDRIAIIQNGRIIAQGDLEELRSLAKTEDKELESIFLKLTESENIKGMIDDLDFKGKE